MQTRVELYPVAVQYALVPDCEVETPLLPRDHPAWMRDAIAISARAREWVAKLKPIAIRVMTFWDHTGACDRQCGADAQRRCERFVSP